MNFPRTRNIYKPNNKKPHKLSRSKLELFVNCARCFFLDLRLGIGRPPMPPFTLNSAVDELLKKEFDIERAKKHAHPLMKSYGIDAVPFPHAKLDKWRHNFTGLQALHESTNLLIFGAIDDVWVNQKKKELYIVDYKATSTNKEIDLNDYWKLAYKRQMEIYQWLARRVEELKNYKISDTGYFVYCNGRKDVKAFDGKLEFVVEVIPYTGKDDWVENTILDAYKLLNQNKIPAADPHCEFCSYRSASQKQEKA